MTFLPEKTDEKGNIICNICNHDQFNYGPSGGETQNIECRNCGAGWNYGRLGMQPINDQAKKAEVMT